MDFTFFWFLQLANVMVDPIPVSLMMNCGFGPDMADYVPIAAIRRLVLIVKSAGKTFIRMPMTIVTNVDAVKLALRVFSVYLTVHVCAYRESWETSVTSVCRRISISALLDAREYSWIS